MGRAVLDDQLDALANRHRRRVPVALLERETDAPIAVPEDVHAGEPDLTTLQAAPFHTHLPKLQSRGFVDRDHDTHEAVAGPRFEEIRPLLTLIGAHSEELPVNWP